MEYRTLCYNTNNRIFEVSTLCRYCLSQKCYFKHSITLAVRSTSIVNGSLKRTYPPAVNIYCGILAIIPLCRIFADRHTNTPVIFVKALQLRAVSIKLKNCNYLPNAVGFHYNFIPSMIFSCALSWSAYRTSKSFRLIKNYPYSSI